MAISHRNGYNNVVFGIESSHDNNEINYDVAFFSDADYKKVLLIDCLGSKQKPQKLVFHTMKK